MDADTAGMEAPAAEFSAESGAALAASPAADAQVSALPAAAPRAARARHIGQLLKIRVPVIARLAVRTLTIRTVRAFSPGSIIEFDRSVETPVEVLINNHVIAHARVVKVGEYFGLQFTQTVDRARRIESFGG